MYDFLKMFNFLKKDPKICILGPKLCVRNYYSSSFFSSTTSASSRVSICFNTSPRGSSVFIAFIAISESDDDYRLLWL